MKTDRLITAGILAIAALLFFTNGGGYDLWPPDEPRYAEVAREMLASGDFLVPRVNGVTYSEKPPLLFWLMAACGVPFGEVTEWAARLPSMLCGLYVVAITFFLGRRLFGPRAAAIGALILMTSLGFWLQARKGQIDMVLAAAMVTALYGFWRWETERAGKWLLVVYSAMAAGLLAKGPPALVFPLLFVFSFYWKNPAGRKRTHWVLGSLSAIAITLLWYVPARLAGADTAEEAIGAGIGGNLFRNTIGRFVLGVSKAQAPWYYLETLPRDFLPWTLICPPLLYWAWKNRKSSQGMWFLYTWIVPAFVFFSISIGKRSLYLVPLFPAIALVLGAAWVQIEASGRFKWVSRGIVLWSALLLGLACAPFALPFVPYTLQNPVHVYVLSAVAGVAGVGGLLWFHKRGPAKAPHILAVQTTLLYVTIVFTAFPEVDHFKSARTVCEPVRQLAERDVAFALYSVGFSREEYIYYARHFHVPVLTTLVGDVDSERLLDEARLQKEAKKTIVRAVEDIPISDLAQIDETERKALEEAIVEAVNAHQNAEAIQGFESDLLKEVHAFMGSFVSPEPAFAFIQEEDWRWLIPLYGEEIPVKIIRDRPVGSRHVLLIANEAAYELTQQYSR